MGELLCDNERVLIGAVDHYPLGIQSGLEHPVSVATELIGGGVDALVASFGVLKAISGSEALHNSRTRLILRVDGNETYLNGEWTERPHWCKWYSVTDAIAVGASALAVNLILGGPSELESLGVVSAAASEAYRSDLHLLVSVVVVDEHKPGQTTYDSARIVYGARVAAELGADIVNLYTNEDVDSLSQVPLNTFVPTVVSGLPGISRGSGGKAGLAQAMELGFAGACLGRGIWRSPAIHEATRAASQIVHSSCDHPEGAPGTLVSRGT